MTRELVHYGLHLGLPVLVAILAYPDRKWFALAVMLAGMAIDLDHLLADPVFDPDRCSIGFHPLHSYPAAAGYLVLLFFKKTRLLALGLVIHILADGADCLLLALDP